MPVLNEEDNAAAPPPGRDPYSAFRVRAYSLYATGNFISTLGRQMLGVAGSYEVFDRTNSATALGLIGLAGALPIIFLALPAGQVADRVSRRGIIIWSQLLGLGSSLALAWLAWHAAAVPAHPLLVQASASLQWLAARFGESGKVQFGPEIPLYFALLLISGVARTFGWAARAPFMSILVTREVLANAVTWNSSLFEIGSVVGPALGGLVMSRYDLFHHGLAHHAFPIVYLVDAAASLVFVGFLLPLRVPWTRAPASQHPLRDLFAGLRFVGKTQVILATITLDLFAVLLGGVTALLPIFARDILHVGPGGLGWLRGAQSAGAIGTAFLLAHLPPLRRAGVTMLWAVAGFGLATILFGISRSFWLSLVALAAAGACDNVSVVVRHTLVQLLTPDAMRGRVAAVNNIFISSSNDLGAFESGLTAAKFGPVLSAVAGGIGTVLVVLAVMVKWPRVQKIGPLAETRAEAA